MGSDGSLGLKAIKEQNGMVMVQDPASAKFDGMPRSAIESVIADVVAPADELPVKLISFLKLNPSVKPGPDFDDKTKSNLEKIIILIREQSGHDFSLYKKNTLFRRIERRKGVHQIDKLVNYVRFLQVNPKEVEILFKELLIGVTSFFRDAAVWDKLRDAVLPAIISQLPDGYIWRAWVPACSTGEEAYSLAIILREVMDSIRKSKSITFQIFATDLDTDAIEKARKGYFSKNIAADISPERLSRYFTLEPDGYRISTAIREMVVFAPQNVIKDPPFTKLDILLCRNMLIYMEPDLQKKIMALFSYSLNPGGLLVLGTAEALGAQAEGFTDVDAKLKIFKRSASGQGPELIDFPSSFYHPRSVTAKQGLPAKIVENIQSITDQILLQYYTPASVLINDGGDIVYITGRTGKYLEPAAGKANLNIFAMARDGLRQVLPGMIRKAQQSQGDNTPTNIKIVNGDEPVCVDVVVQRIDNPDTVRGLMIIVFKECSVAVERESLLLKKGKSKLPARQAELEKELQRSYEDLQSTREEMQTSQEELKSTNEELQSTNEELQSTNEELTTSKEEMQSLNEELQTVNAELQSKVNDYVRANDDMKNLLNSIEIATLFLDKELNIRRFTEQVTKIFKLRDVDAGRPFTDLVSELDYPEIAKHAMKVIKTLISCETAAMTPDGRWFNVRIMPYRTLDDHIDGLVMTFTDITEYKKLESELKAARDQIKD